VLCHVKNTGRCLELLVEDAEVSLSLATNPARLTAYDLIAVRKGERWVNIDSQVPNLVFADYLRQGRYLPLPLTYKREVYHGNSRFDFYYQTGDEEGFIEVKGVTLEQDDHASFPDAPTLRGSRHLRELMADCAEGYQAHMVFVIQMEGIKAFSANDSMDPEFGRTLREAIAKGVRVDAFECQVSADTLEISKPVPIILS